MSLFRYLIRRLAAPGLSAPLRRFARRERGAITVDWTVLSGAAVGLGIGAVVLVSGGLGNLAGNIGDTLSGTTVSLAPDAPGGEAAGPVLAVDLQAADQATLQRIRGIGAARAVALLKARDEDGLNLNTASRSDLEAISGIGPVLSERTIRFRDEGCVDDVCV